MASASPVPSGGPRRGKAFTAVLLGAALLFAGFIALGLWQLQRLAWKTDLITRIEQRRDAAPAPPPATAEKAADEYRRVRAEGVFDHGRETLVRASTELGTGHWVLTPLRLADGRWLLVNRGFVPPEAKDRARRAADEPAGPVAVTGLLRLSEPAGSLLQANDVAADRWYSRDVAAIAAARGLDGQGGAVAPYFIDAVADAGQADTWPRPGLTVLRFSNNHLSYALTWFALAAMMAGATVFLLRDERRRRNTTPATPANAATATDRAAEPD